MMDYAIETLVFVIFAAVAAFFLYRMNRYGGFTAAIFGARIDRTVGAVAGENQGSIAIDLKVHILRRDTVGKLEGVEIIAKSFASYRKANRRRIARYGKCSAASFKVL